MKQSKRAKRQKKPTPEERLRERERLFPGIKVIDTHQLGYSPLHWIFRTSSVQKLFTSTEWRVLTYVQMRLNPEFYCRIETKEIVKAFGYTKNSKITPYLETLKQKGFILIREEDGNQYIATPDPVGVVRALIDKGTIPEEDVAEVIEDCRSYGVPLFISQATNGADLDLFDQDREDELTGEHSAVELAKELEWKEIANNGG